MSADLLLQVKRGAGERLPEGRGVQDHHPHHLPRGSHPEAGALREGLALRLLRLQASRLQVAPADGVQGEAGKRKSWPPGGSGELK